jgi:hypothetical protein
VAKQAKEERDVPNLYAIDYLEKPKAGTSTADLFSCFLITDR